MQTLSLGPWKSRHFGLLSRPGPCRSESVRILCLACSQCWRPSWRHCSWERCQSDIHSKMREGTVTFLSQFFFSFEPVFDERSKKLVVPGPNGQLRALGKPPFWPSFSTRALWFTGWCALFGVQPVLAAFLMTLLCSWDGGALPVWHSLENVCSVLPIADVGMALIKFPLAEDRGLSTSRSRFNRHSPGFNQHSPGFVCSVLRIADPGMAFSDRGLSRSRFNRPSPGFNRHSPVSFAPCFGSQMREWLSL